MTSVYNRGTISKIIFRELMSIIKFGYFIVLICDKRNKKKKGV